MVRVLQLLWNKVTIVTFLNSPVLFKHLRLLATVSLPSGSKAIRFKATVGGDLSDIAIDDFLAFHAAPSTAPSNSPVPTISFAPTLDPSFEPSHMPVPAPSVLPTPAPTGTPAPSSPTPLPSPSPTQTMSPTTAPLACDFETDLCSFSNSGDYAWTRHTGETPSSPGTGP